MEIHHLMTEQRSKAKGQKSKLLLFALCSLAFALPLSAAVTDGYVVRVESATVYLDWGKSSGVAAGDQFKVYRAGETLKHPVTGEVLGQAEADLGQGVLDNVEEKFSTGKLVGAPSGIKAGDRTRHLEGAQGSALGAQTGIPSPQPGAQSVVPKELWRSEPISSEATGLALGDVDGDGKKEVVVAYRDHVEVYRWNGQKLESLATFKPRGYSNYLAVETGDIDGAGHDKIFASLFIDGVKRSKTFVLEYSQGTLHEVGRLDGFVRALEHSDGRRELVWQDMSLARELHMKQPAPLTKTPKGFREGSPLKLPRALNDDQLFGYAWGDWDGDGVEDFAFLQNGERLRLLFSATKASADAPGSSGAKDAKWSSGEVYGGTKADFEWENEQVGSVFPRLLNWKTVAGKSQLLAPHNIPFTPIRFARLKIYKQSEIIDLAWNGLEMAPLWKLPLAGALADFGMGDVLQHGPPQLWVAAVGAGDKTILLAFQIP